MSEVVQMPRYPRGHKDVQYWAPGHKKPITGSTKATSDFLAVVCGEHPEASIGELRALITDRSRYILEPEAVAVLDAYIKCGYGGFVPHFT